MWGGGEEVQHSKEGPLFRILTQVVHIISATLIQKVRMNLNAFNSWLKS